jgi:hypothetical protein
MASSSAAVNSVFNKLLGRDAGTEGQTYWSGEWEKAKAAAIAGGKSAADAEASATASISKNVGRSSEAFDYIQGESDLATTAYDSSAMGIPDWFKFQDENVNVGARTEDWATNLQTSNLENYLDETNYQYGMQQGNVVGREGSEWWGYQETQDIQSYLAQGDDFATAQSKARANIERDIGANTGAANYKKLGSIGYGNPLQIKTSTDTSGDILSEERYLDLSSRAIADGMGIGGGSRTITKYETDEDGEYVLDDDGNQIAMTDDDGNPITANPYQWSYVPDDNAPGGYRIEPIPFNTGTQTSTTGHDWYKDNYQRDGAIRGGGGANPFSIPANVQNVDAARFTSGGADKLNLAQWAETGQGKDAIAAGEFEIKNKWMKDTTGDGNLNFVPSGIDHSTTNSNLGLAPGQEVPINWGEGWQGTFSGGPKTSNYVPPEQQQAMGGAGGGGNTIINLDTNQKSTTAADKLVKRDDRGAYSGQGRKGFSTMKYKPTGNISTLGIV